MKTFGLIVGALLVCVVVFMLVYPTYNWHQKLTVTVQTPDGLRTASSVISATVSTTPGFGIAGTVFSSSYGDSVVLELPNGKYLFVIKNQNPTSIAREVFSRQIRTDDKKPFSVKAFFSELEDLRMSLPVRRGISKYPLMVTFTDINDPLSVIEVKPDDFASIFGEGYSLKGLVLEITDEPLTRGEVVKVLKWLPEIFPDYLDGGVIRDFTVKNQLANSLSFGSFVSFQTLHKEGK